LAYWLIGEAPNDATINRPDLWLTPDESGVMHSANRLLELTGWTRAQFLAIFTTRTNVWAHPRRIWLQEGHCIAAKIAERSSKAGARGVVILGVHAAEAFGLAGETPFEWVGRYAVIPHPSGRCRYWNTPNAKERAREFFAAILASELDSANRAAPE